MSEPFNLHDSYEQHEKTWKKRLFDPFQRGQRFLFRVHDQEIVTTVAQLNFFKWAIQYGVIDWATEHKDEIRSHQDKIKSERRKLIQSQPNREKKRMRLTKANNSHCLVYVQPMRISLAGPAKKARASEEMEVDEVSI